MKEQNQHKREHEQEKNRLESELEKEQKQKQKQEQKQSLTQSKKKKTPPPLPTSLPPVNNVPMNSDEVNINYKKSSKPPSIYWEQTLLVSEYTWLKLLRIGSLFRYNHKQTPTILERQFENNSIAAVSANDGITCAERNDLSAF